MTQERKSPQSRNAPRGWGSLVGRRAGRAAYVLAAAPLGLIAGWLLGGAMLPILQAVTIFPLFCSLVLRNEWHRALGAILAWACWTALLVGGLSWRFPEAAQERILLGETYQEEMFEWIRSGEGKEGDIRRFLPEHALHFSVFAVLTAVSGGLLGLVMGAALLNYMSFYVGTLLGHAPHWMPLILIAWPPWAAVRVVGFVVFATALSAWVYGRWRGKRVEPRRWRRYLWSAALLLVLDVLLKWLLAPTWREWLAAVTDLA